MERQHSPQFDKLSDKSISNVRVSEIRVGERIRENLGNLDILQDSLQRHGLMQPIILDKKLNLIAGHRRLEAAKNLGWRYINAIIIAPGQDLQRLEMELEENLARKDFTPEEIAKGQKKLEELRRNTLWKKLLYWIKRFLSWLTSLFRRRP